MAVTVRLRTLDAPQNQLLGWGAGLIGSTVTTRYLYPWYSDQMAEVYEGALIVPGDGTLKNLKVIHGVPAGNGGPVLYTVRVAGVGTLLKVSLPSTGGFGQNITDSITVNAGDRVSVMVSKAAEIGESPRNVTTSVDLV